MRHGSIGGKGEISMKILRMGYVVGGFLSLVLSLSAQTFTTLYSFNFGDGANPYAGLIQATNGDLYGTASYFGGGNSQSGTVFKITPNGKLTTLHSFDFMDGAYPEAGLIQATNGDLYGTTQWGGTGNCGVGCGTVFKMTTSGKLTSLYPFCSKIENGVCIDGSEPQAGLVEAPNGNLYGTTYAGGFNNGGTIFTITPKGALTTLYSFCSQGGMCTDGNNPYAGLVRSTDGNFYGTTYAGGTNNGGTVFEITPSGALTTLYSFCSQSGCTDGANPYAGLVQATDGNFYGTASLGGANGGGTVFRVTPSGKLTVLYSFCSQSGCADGANPLAALIQATNGAFYGTTEWGGSLPGCRYGISRIPCGTVFSLSVGLGPFVETQPTSGEVGAAVKILGTDLKGATSVTFNGTAAAFKVVSAFLITTTVPEGATTGKVEVKTSKGTLKSNVVFRVMK
jgi:uncharacterized repeat protein (TIGR03803 family)